MSEKKTRAFWTTELAEMRRDWKNDISRLQALRGALWRSDQAMVGQVITVLEAAERAAQEAEAWIYRPFRPED